MSLGRGQWRDWRVCRVSYSSLGPHIIIRGVPGVQDNPCISIPDEPFVHSCAPVTKFSLRLLLLFCGDTYTFPCSHINPSDRFIILSEVGFTGRCFSSCLSLTVRIVYEFWKWPDNFRIFPIVSNCIVLLMLCNFIFTYLSKQRGRISIVIYHFGVYFFSKMSFLFVLHDSI